MKVYGRKGELLKEIMRFNRSKDHRSNEVVKLEPGERIVSAIVHTSGLFTCQIGLVIYKPAV